MQLDTARNVFNDAFDHSGALIQLIKYFESQMDKAHPLSTEWVALKLEITERIHKLQHVSHGGASRRSLIDITREIVDESATGRLLI
ncbi:MAG: hypothetical protein EOO38_03170 [Cytophagaceae bacterium]|nr:MAG: hypothetical protein EOO38_03170 [Cytophagaceae bacterium]